jgi:hypothetical protein
METTLHLLAIDDDDDDDDDVELLVSSDVVF